MPTRGVASFVGRDAAAPRARRHGERTRRDGARDRALPALCAGIGALWSPRETVHPLMRHCIETIDEGECAPLRRAAKKVVREANALLEREGFRPCHDPETDDRFCRGVDLGF